MMVEEDLGSKFYLWDRIGYPFWISLDDVQGEFVRCTLSLVEKRDCMMCRL